jgi:energy-coupling factor transporter ATP-binding protein EcfA2
VPGTTDSLLAGLERLRAALEGVELPLEVAGAADARHVRREVTGQLEDYLLPRARALDAPLLAVVGGSTGAGKSTLVNALVGAEVSPAGVLRPTTRGPVLVCHPSDAAAFAGPRVLPGLDRHTGAGAGGPGELRVVVSERLDPGLALLDAPDIDSVVEGNRRLAAALLAAADLWLFVTTASRGASSARARGSR